MNIYPVRWWRDLGRGVKKAAGEFCNSIIWQQTKCICGRMYKRSSDDDVALHDRFGINVPTIRCSSCGTIRPALRPWDKDLKLYYADGTFEALHPGQATKGDDLYRRQAEIAMRASGFAYDRFVAVREFGGGLQGGCSRFMGGDFRDVRCGKCDLAIAHHVLEHVSDPVFQLEKWANTLTDGGRLVVAVPNTDDVGAHRLVAKHGMDVWWTFDHLWHWTLETIKQPFELAGLNATVSLLSAGTVSHVGSLLVVARRKA